MTLASIGHAVGTFIKGVAAACGSLTIGQIVALGAVIGIGGYTAYVLIKSAKERIRHARDQKSEDRTVTENILDQDTAEVIGLKTFASQGRKNNGKKPSKFSEIAQYEADQKANEPKDAFSRIQSLVVKHAPKKIREKLMKSDAAEEAKSMTDAEWRAYYQDMIHRTNDSPEDYKKWRETHPPVQSPNVKKKPQKVKKVETGDLVAEAEELRELLFPAKYAERDAERARNREKYMKKHMLQEAATLERDFRRRKEYERRKAMEPFDWNQPFNARDY